MDIRSVKESLFRVVGKYGGYSCDFVKRRFLLLVVLFIFSFVSFGLYKIDFFVKNLVLAILFLAGNLYLIKKLLYKQAYATKIVIIVIVLLCSYFSAQYYSGLVFEKIGVNNFINNSGKGVSDNSLISDVSDGFSNLTSILEGPKIDGNWVHNFMDIVNLERTKQGLVPLRESSQLNVIARARFEKMMENPNISHYGASLYNVGEVVYYPKGSSEQAYVDDLKKEAILHWNLMMDPTFYSYGYYIGEGPTSVISGYCSTTEIPGPNIDVENFFEEKGCSTSTENSIWLVINMS